MENLWNLDGVQEAAKEVKQLLGKETENIKDGLILGSGLGSFAEKEMDVLEEIPFDELLKKISNQNGQSTDFQRTGKVEGMPKN